MPESCSPLSRYAAAHQLNVPLLPPTNVAVPRIVPNPLAVPSQFPCVRTLPAGPGVKVSEVNLYENSEICLPDAIQSPPSANSHYLRFIFRTGGLKPTCAAGTISAAL